jgi:WD40 repeat protein
MPWPHSQDYNEAIQNPATSFSDAELRQGHVVTNAQGLPMPCSGNFADVYQMRCPDGSRWAVKCFTRGNVGLRERYQEISAWLRKVKLPFTVDFSYLEQGIRVAGKWHPVLKMQWVEGLTLNQFVAQNLDKPAMLEALVQIWGKMAKYLRAAEVGHCDLQHGNVLLVRGTGGALALKLIDYDGIWIPPLTMVKSGEVGHPSYQHPQRLREGTYNIDVDRFPLLLVATALRALKAKGRALWEKYDNGDNILFKETDLLDPNQSALVQELLNLGDPPTTALLIPLLKSLRHGLESAPLLEEIMPGARPAPAPALSPRSTPGPTQHATLSTVLSAARIAPAPTLGQDAQDFGKAVPAASDSPVPFPIVATIKSVPVWAFAATITLLVVLSGAVTVFVAVKGNNPPKSALVPSLANNGPSVKSPPLPVQDIIELKGHTKSALAPSLANNGPLKWVVDVLFSPDGRLLASVGLGEVNVWDMPTGKEVFTLKSDTGFFDSASFKPDGTRLATASSDGTVKVWDAGSGQELRTLSGTGGPVGSVCFSPDGSRLAASCNDGHFNCTMRMWDSSSGQEIRTVNCTNSIRSVSFSPDGEFVAAVTAGRLEQTGMVPGEVKVWNAHSGQEVLTLKGHNSGFWTACFSPNSKSLATAGEGYAVRGSPIRLVPGEVKVWDVTTGQEALSLKGDTGDPLSACFSPDGSRLAVGCGGGLTATMWNARTGEKQFTLEGAGGNGPRGLRFNSDGTRLAVTAAHSGGPAMQVWNLPPLEEHAAAVRPLPSIGLTSPTITCVCFSPNGKTVAFGSVDGSLKLWLLPDTP